MSLVRASLVIYLFQQEKDPGEKEAEEALGNIKNSVKITVENKYSDGPSFLYDKREVIVPRRDVVNMEGIIDIARVHERFGTPMTGSNGQGYTRENNMEETEVASDDPPLSTQLVMPSSTRLPSELKTKKPQIPEENSIWETINDAKID